MALIGTLLGHYSFKMSEDVAIPLLCGGWIPLANYCEWPSYITNRNSNTTLVWQYLVGSVQWFITSLVYNDPSPLLSGSILLAVHNDPSPLLSGSILLAVHNDSSPLLCTMIHHLSCLIASCWQCTVIHHLSCLVASCWQCTMIHHLSCLVASCWQCTMIHHLSCLIASYWQCILIYHLSCLTIHSWWAEEKSSKYHPIVMATAIDMASRNILRSLSLLAGKDRQQQRLLFNYHHWTSLLSSYHTIAVELVVRFCGSDFEAFFTQFNVEITIDNSTLKVLPRPFTEWEEIVLMTMVGL